MRFLVAALLLVFLTLQAQDSILPATLPVAWNLQRPDATYATSQVVSVTGQPFASKEMTRSIQPVGSPPGNCLN